MAIWNRPCTHPQGHKLESTRADASGIYRECIRDGCRLRLGMVFPGAKADLLNQFFIYGSTPAFVSKAGHIKPNTH